MKDVAGCDKPRGGAKQPLIRGCLNGATHLVMNKILPDRIYKSGRVNHVN